MGAPHRGGREAGRSRRRGGGSKTKHKKERGKARGWRTGGGEREREGLSLSLPSLPRTLSCVSPFSLLGLAVRARVCVGRH